MMADWAEDRATELVALIRAQHIDRTLLATEAASISAMASALRLARAEGERDGVVKAFDAARNAINGREHGGRK